MPTRGSTPSGLPRAAWALCSGRAAAQTLNAAEKCCTRQTHWREQSGQRCLVRGYESLAPVSEVFRKGLAAIRRQQETSRCRDTTLQVSGFLARAYWGSPGSPEAACSRGSMSAKGAAGSNFLRGEAQAMREEGPLYPAACLLCRICNLLWPPPDPG